ncbi:MAG TPA: hypothetical protein VFE72_02025 [Lysobacter sp.]|nr:hypothetical protein [Lysobacter sp.]
MFDIASPLGRLRAIARRRLPLLAIAAIAICSPVSGRSSEPVELPEVVQGLWQPDTDEGKAACRRYLAAPDGSDEAWSALVGALIVHPALLHHVSDMGEGNFIEVDAVEPAGAVSWHVRGRLGIDGEAEPGAPRVEAVLVLEGPALTLRETLGTDVFDYRYARCTRAP